jgi:hypothetical protein
MKCAPVLLVAAIVIPLAGCVLSGKPKPVAVTPAPPQAAVPAPPPEPLSIPQTTVELPPEQVFHPESLNTQQPEEAPQTQSKPPAAPKPPAPHPQNAGPTKPPDTQPQAQPEQPAPEPARTPITEILSPDEQKDYREKAHKFQSDTFAVLAGARIRTPNQRRQKEEINNFLKQSQKADEDGDLRLAVSLAERAYTLAKELQSGK